MAMSAAGRRYIWRFFPTMVAYVVAILFVTWLFENHPPAGALKYFAALLPAVPVLGIIAIIGLHLLEETDEFTRMRLAQTLLVAVGITLSFCTTWGFLEIYAGAPRIELFLVVPGFFTAEIVAGLIVWGWYR
jgi:hypothetical protein